MASTAIQLSGLGMCWFNSMYYNKHISKTRHTYTTSTAIQLSGLGMCWFNQIVYRVLINCIDHRTKG